MNQGQSSSEDFKLEAFNEAENLDFLFEFHSHQEQSDGDLANLQSGSDVIEKNAELDKILMQQLVEKENSQKFAKMQEFRRSLPSFAMRKVHVVVNNLAKFCRYILGGFRNLFVLSVRIKLLWFPVRPDVEKRRRCPSLSWTTPLREVKGRHVVLFVHNQEGSVPSL